MDVTLTKERCQILYSEGDAPMNVPNISETSGNICL